LHVLLHRVGYRGAGGGGDFLGYLMALVLVPLALRVFSVADERAHLAKALAARLARERFVLHVHVPVENVENMKAKIEKVVILIVPTHTLYC